MIIKGQFVNIRERQIYPAHIEIENGKIKNIHKLEEANQSGLPYILPGFIDAHVHIESSMLVPAEFARLAVVHGTIATISDPHEIANVCGMDGINFMIDNGRQVPFKFFFGAPSCVPATIFETAGANITVADVDALMKSDDIRYLSEMMNFPGVLMSDDEVMQKIAIARKYGKPVDGHAPGLRGGEAKKYIDAGISTDHECFTYDEAKEKLGYGMKILIREGSAAKNFEALIGLLHDHPDEIMFCSDDKHPDSLVDGHINQLCKRAVAKGIDVFHVLQAACINPALHYKTKTGLLSPGDAADFILVKDLQHFEVHETYIDGNCVAKNGKSLIERRNCKIVNQFAADLKTDTDFRYLLNKWGDEENIEQVYAIEALDGQLITNKLVLPVTDFVIANDCLHANPEKDILKIVVVNRYTLSPIAKSFIKNTGLKKGAIASSVAHDSHNIVAIGADDESLCKAVNMIIETKGGISCVNEEASMLLPLPVAGLMTDQDGYETANAYAAIDKMAKEAGCTLSSPFMTLSFMALLVIPHLKLSDKGLFDGDQFKLL